MLNTNLRSVDVWLNRAFTFCYVPNQLFLFCIWETCISPSVFLYAFRKCNNNFLQKYYSMQKRTLSVIEQYHFQIYIFQHRLIWWKAFMVVSITYQRSGMIHFFTTHKHSWHFEYTKWVPTHYKVDLQVQVSMSMCATLTSNIIPFDICLIHNFNRILL